jgi:thiol-disulfide isomerase/thioredoxin
MAPQRTVLMRKWLPVACVLAAAALVARADDKPTEAGKALKGMVDEAKGKLSAERDPKARQELLNAYANKFLEHAEKNPKDASALEALLLVLQVSQPGKGKDDPGAKALAAIKQSQLKSKQIGKGLMLLAVRGEEGVELIKTVIAENPDKKVQGKAAKVMKQVREEYAKVGERMKDDEQLKKQVEASRGKEFAKNLLDNADKFTKEAKEYDKLLKEKYADVFPEIAVGKPAPEVVAQDLDGKSVKLSQLKGKVVVLDVWATWCGPCRSMIPHSKKLVEKMKDKPFVLVSASADQKKDTVKEFLQKTPMPWTHWWVGPSDGLVEDWQIEAFPTVYLIDAKGVLREKIVGVNNEKIDEVAEKLVKEAQESKKTE